MDTNLAFGEDSTEGLAGSIKIDQLRSNLLNNNSPYWVVLGKEVDKILGIVKRERLLTALLQGHSQLTPLDLCQAVEYVPEMIRIDRLLTSFNKDKCFHRNCK